MVSQITKDITRSMNKEQFSQVIAAILDGKYSWACLLILKFTGYNPLHYMPYRTYNRLIKDNGLARRSEKKHSKQTKEPSLEVYNLPHKLPLQSSSLEVRGGHIGDYIWDVDSLSLN